MYITTAYIHCSEEMPIFMKTQVFLWALKVFILQDVHVHVSFFSD